MILGKFNVLYTTGGQNKYLVLARDNGNLIFVFSGTCFWYSWLAKCQSLRHVFRCFRVRLFSPNACVFSIGTASLGLKLRLESFSIYFYYYLISSFSCLIVCFSIKSILFIPTPKGFRYLGVFYFFESCSTTDCYWRLRNNEYWHLRNGKSICFPFSEWSQIKKAFKGKRRRDDKRSCNQRE